MFIKSLTPGQSFILPGRETVYTALAVRGDQSLTTIEYFVTEHGNKAANRGMFTRASLTTVTVL